MKINLPPTVRGPIYTTSKSVWVDGPLPGSQVNLLINGVLNDQRTANSTTTSFSIAPNQLSKGHKITASWTWEGETSDPSSIVWVDSPSEDLDSLMFASKVNACSDWITLTNASVGATVEVFRSDGILVGEEIAEHDSVIIKISGSIKEEEILTAQQTLQTSSGIIKSELIRSKIPVESFGKKDLISPPFIYPILDCAARVQIGGIREGATTRLRFDGNTLDYAYRGTTLFAILGGEKAHPQMAFTAQQFFGRCNIGSVESPRVFVDQEMSVKPPSLPDFLNCLSRPAFEVNNLEGGALLSFYVVDHLGIRTIVGRIGVPAEATSLPCKLSDLLQLIPSNGELFVVQEVCEKKVESKPCRLESLYQAPLISPFIQPPAPIECTRWVPVASADHHSVLRLYSDFTNLPLSNEVYIHNSGWIHTYRSLIAGEKLTLRAEISCLPSHLRESPAVEVSKLPTTLPAPKIIQPVRFFHHRIVFQDVIVGAQVHVFINGRYRLTETVANYGLSAAFIIYVTFERGDEEVTAIQELCAVESKQTYPPVPVKMGEMILSSDPPFLEQGNPASLMIKAVDIDNSQTHVSGTISFSGRVIGMTNRPLSVSPPHDQDTMNFQVAAPGFNPKTLSVQLNPPAIVVANPAILTLTLRMFFNASMKVVKEITWKLSGPTFNLTKTETPNTETSATQFQLPPPTDDFTPLTISCQVTFEYENFEFNPGVSGIGSANCIVGGLIEPSPCTVQMHWNGTDNMLNFRVIYALEIDRFVIREF